MNHGGDKQVADCCHTCGKQFAADDRFCGACGTVRPPQPNFPPTVVEHKKLGVLPASWSIGAIAAVAVALAAVGAGAFVAASSSNDTKHVVSTSVTTPSSPAGGASSLQTSPSSEQSSSAPTETEANSGTTQTETSPPQAVSPLDAVNGYWMDIRAHNFAQAYAYLAPGAIELSESQFIASERGAHIRSARFHGRVTSSSQATATVEVISLTTDDAQFNCRVWSGSYEMTDDGSGWQIARANLSPRPCSG